MFDPKVYYHDRYIRLKSERRCVACGDPLEESNKLTRCEVCRDKVRASRMKGYYKRKRRELMGKCGAENEKNNMAL